MTLREFLRFHLLKVLLALVVIQMIIFAIVQNYNHKPQTQRDQAVVIEERTVKITPVSNDSDKDDHTELSVLKVSTPDKGEVEQRKNILYYTPDPGFVGVDSFAYTITDGKKESKESYVVITVNKNLEPIGEKDFVTAYIGTAVAIDVLGNDMDREEDSIFIKEFTNPIYGGVKLSNNELIYSSGTTAKSDSFHYVISDGRTNSEKVTVLITVKDKNDPCYPWLSVDIGNCGIPGSFTCLNKSFILEASGRDIWRDQDGLHYAYQYIRGDCEMLAKIESIEGNHEWAKAAIMVRETLSGGSKTSMILMANRRGVRSQHRVETNGDMFGSNPHSELKAPYWLKLVRKGDTFSYFMSDNGVNWKKIDTQENPMSKNVYIGFGFTGHDNSELAKAVFSNYRLQARAAKFGN